MRTLRRLRRPLLFAIVLVAALAPSHPTAFAQDGAVQDGAGAVPVTWSVRPAPAKDGSARPNFVFDAEPGDTISDALVVSNDGELNLVLGVYISDAFTTPEGDTDLLARGETPRDLGAWASAEVSSVTVPAGGQIEVPFTVEVPDDADAGDHVGGIVTSLTVAEEGTHGNRVRIERRLGSRISVRVGGSLRPGLTFTSLSAEYHHSPNPFAPGAMELTYTVENTGNVRLRATRTARVATGLGLGERVDEAADMDELLPGNSFTFTQRVDGVWPGGATTSSVELEPYDASGAQLQPPATTAIARTSMTLVPWSVIAVAVVILAVAMAAAMVGRRRRRRDRPAV